jgi:tripartite motif-containing protein 71
MRSMTSFCRASNSRGVPEVTDHRRPGGYRGATVAVAVLVVVAVMFGVGPVGSAGAQSKTDPPMTYKATVSTSGVAYVNQTYVVTQAETLNFSLSWPGTAQLNLFVKNPSGTIVGQAIGDHNPQTLVLPVTAAGKYVLGVKALTGSANYTLVVTTTATGTGPTVVTYRSQIGQDEQPEMYPSGVDIDRATGEIVVADTGDDRVTAYTSAGKQMWQDGLRGPKTDFNFSNPRDVAIVDGNVYVADTGFNRIRVVNEITGDNVGSGVWSQSFPSVIGISAGVDGSGSPVILATDADNNDVSEFTLNDTLERTIGTKGTIPGELSAPRDAATDAAGDVFVADYEADRIVVYSPTGTYKYEWGSYGTAHGQFRSPYGVTLSDSGNVYVADSNNERIEEFTAAGVYVATYGSLGTDPPAPGTFFQLRRVAVGRGANPYVIGADLWGGYLQEFNAVGASIATFGNGPPPDGGFNEPYGITDSGNAVVVADTDNQRMEAFNAASGVFDFSFGERGFGATNEGFNWPRDIAYSAASNTYWVADTKNFRVTEFTSSGVPTGRIIGNKIGSALGSFNWIYGVATLGSDVVVADTLNDRVQLVNPAVAGAAGIVWSTSGFNQPRAVTVVGNTVYVADTDNNRVVELSGSNGSVLATLPLPSGELSGIAVAPNGHIWVSDTSDSRIYEMTSTGVVLQTFGTFGTGPSQFNEPAGLAIGTVGSATVLYVVDQENSRVETFTLS